MSASIEDIVDWLQEGTLLHIDWWEEERQLALLIECERRTQEGERLEEPLRLLFCGVNGISSFYNSWDLSSKPTIGSPSRRLSLKDIVNKDIEPTSPILSINEKRCTIDNLTALFQEELYGLSMKAWPTPCTHVLGLKWGEWDDEDCSCTLMVGFESLQVYEGKNPLTLDEWSQQNDAFMQGWKEYWDSSEENEGSDWDGNCVEATMIPAGENIPDLSYQPPQHPAFLVEPSNVPEKLLRPIQIYTESILARDWSRIAQISHSFGEPTDEETAFIKSLYEDIDFGRWNYIRKIEDWWINKNQACVIARGVEHTMPDEEFPAENLETVITYVLRHFENKWFIWETSQGWVLYGSAPEDDGEQIWKNDWELKLEAD